VKRAQVTGIEVAVVENPALAFDLARTLVESTCRAILGERKSAQSEDDDLPRLFRTATNHLPYLPPTASDRAAARESLTRTLNGLSTAIQGVCELRNRCGFASHGSGSPRAATDCRAVPSPNRFRVFAPPHARDGVARWIAPSWLSPHRRYPSCLGSRRVRQ
jgi:hypothetical protein